MEGGLSLFFLCHARVLERFYSPLIPPLNSNSNNRSSEKLCEKQIIMMTMMGDVVLERGRIEECVAHYIL